MKDYFTIDGKSSADFGIYITYNGIYATPERDVKRIEVPGRNGDLIIDNNRFKNMDIPYIAFITENFDRNYDDFASFLRSKRGYFRLEDTFKPQEYRIAYFNGPLELTKLKAREKGRFTITFHCKPQRFLKSGERPIAITSTGTSINNPTYMTAKPLVRVYGTGEVNIGTTTITITSANEYTDIDCEAQMAYKGSTNCNGNIQLNNRRFFEIPAGITGVTFGEGITRVEITPRWYK